MPRKAKKKEVEKAVEKVKIECICKNVHLGIKDPVTGKPVILKAYRESNRDNWADGDTYKVDSALAEFLVDRKQVRII